MAKRAAKTGMKTLLVKDNTGEFKVEIPMECRITFGPNVPYQRKGGYMDQQAGYSLRVYASGSKDDLMAVFSNVVSFRDITIPVSKLVIREAGKSIWKSDEHGYTAEESVTRDIMEVPQLLGNSGKKRG